MSQTDVALPLPEYSSIPPPDYNPAAVATERVIASTYGPPRLFRPSLSSHRPPSANYTVHSNSHILVILPRPDPTNRWRPLPLLPAYGHRAAVSGSLLLTPGSWTSTISEVAISLEGRASSVLIQPGVREPASSRKLFSVSQTLWKGMRGHALNLSDRLKFEVRFPQSIPGGHTQHIALPPTFEQETQMAFGIATHIKIEYTLKVDVWRRGLWRHKRKVHVPLQSTFSRNSYILAENQINDSHSLPAQDLSRPGPDAPRTPSFAHGRETIWRRKREMAACQS